MDPWQSHPRRDVFAGACEPNDPHAGYGLLRVAGASGHMRTIVARFRDRASADAACADLTAELTSDQMRYEVVGIK